MNEKKPDSSTSICITEEQNEELVKTIRLSNETGSLVSLSQFLKNCGIDIPERELSVFRDYLIVNRFDMKDLEPQARARLRDNFLAIESDGEMSDDYRQAVCSGSVPSCRDCKWFITPPDDGGEGGDKSCVQLGTKGADVSCFGFTYRPN